MLKAYGGGLTFDGSMYYKGVFQALETLPIRDLGDYPAPAVAIINNKSSMLVWGQSNIAIKPATVSLDPSVKYTYYNNGTVEIAQCDHHILTHLGKLIKAHSSLSDVFFTHYAVSGSSISQWQPGGAYFNELIARNDLLKAYDTEALVNSILDYQGESDTQGNLPAAYPASYDIVEDALRLEVGGCHVFKVQIGPSQSSPYMQANREASWRLDERKAPYGRLRTHMIPAHHLPLNWDEATQTLNPLHIWGEGGRLLAELVFEFYKKYVLGESVDCDAPILEQITKSGNLITVTLDRDLNAEASLTGDYDGFIKVYDSNHSLLSPTLITRKSTHLASIEITLPSDPGSIKVEFSPPFQTEFNLRYERTNTLKSLNGTPALAFGPLPVGSY